MLPAMRKSCRIHGLHPVINVIPAGASGRYHWKTRMRSKKPWFGPTNHMNQGYSLKQAPAPLSIATTAAAEADFPWGSWINSCIRVSAITAPAHTTGS
jgi:hypothetical protein